MTAFDSKHFPNDWTEKLRNASREYVAAVEDAAQAKRAAEALEIRAYDAEAARLDGILRQAASALINRAWWIAETCNVWHCDFAAIKGAAPTAPHYGDQSVGKVAGLIADMALGTHGKLNGNSIAFFTLQTFLSLYDADLRQYVESNGEYGVDRTEALA